MNEFDNETYIISFQPGCNGNFIAKLIWSILHSTYNVPFTFPEGHAHTLPTFKSSKMAKVHWGLSPSSLEVSRFYSIDRIDSGVCIFLDHNVPDWDNMFKTFPNAKNIIITLSPIMYRRQYANFYYKNVVRNNTPEFIKQSWKEFPGVTDDVLKCDILPIPDNILRNQFERSSKHQHPFSYPFNDDSIIPDQFQDKVFPIKLYDIIHNKNYVLTNLRKITQRGVPSHVYQTYDNYLNAQYNLIPWLDESIGGQGEI